MKALKNVTNFGLPKNIRSDNEIAFTCLMFKKLWLEEGKELLFGLPDLHTATGFVERTIKNTPRQLCCVLKVLLEPNRELCFFFGPKSIQLYNCLFSKIILVENLICHWTIKISLL